MPPPPAQTNTLQQTPHTQAAPQPSTGIGRFLSRSPVLDEQYQLQGYELSLRGNVPVPVLPGATSLEQMQDELLLVSVIDMNFQQALGNRPTFIRIASDTLFNPMVEQVPPGKVVLCISPGNADAKLLARCDALAAQGILLGLDDVDATEETAALIGLCSHVRLDVTRHDAMSLAGQMIHILRNGTPQLIACNVESEEAWLSCTKLGFKQFEGHYFSALQPGTQNRLDTSRLRVMDLLNAVMDRAGIPELEAKFKLDAALSYKLLRYINSPAVGLRNSIESIGHALMLLGHDQLYRWLTLLLFSQGNADPRSQILLKNAIIRARFTETLGQDHLPKEQRGGLFIVGIISLLEALLNMPMAQIVAQLRLPTAMEEALTLGKGIYAPYLRLATACENFDQDTIAQVAAEAGLDPDAVNLAHVNALIWSEGIDL